MITSNPQAGGEDPRANVPEHDLTSSDPYNVLGLNRGASLREVKRNYFALVRHYPPETEPDAFKTIRAAYEQLRTPETKAKTDLFLFRPPKPWEARKRRQRLELEVDMADISRFLWADSDLGRTDFQDDYRPVRL